jgi:hypothetical protein
MTGTQQDACQQRRGSACADLSHCFDGSALRWAQAARRCPSRFRASPCLLSATGRRRAQVFSMRFRLSRVPRPATLLAPTSIGTPSHANSSWGNSARKRLGSTVSVCPKAFARAAKAQGQGALRTGDADVCQPSLFLDGVERDRIAMRQQIFFEAGKVHVWILETLGGVQGGQHHGIGVGVVFLAIGNVEQGQGAATTSAVVRDSSASWMRFIHLASSATLLRLRSASVGVSAVCSSQSS